MPRSQRTGTAILRAGIDLPVDGKAPTAIRLLKAGENRCDRAEYPTFMFDDQSANDVMAAFRDSGIPRLFGDWNHGMLEKTADRHRAEASCSFVPEIRNGELWAADIKWTEEGRRSVESLAYNLFSPAVELKQADDGQWRVTQLINFALVNLAGLKDIQPLLAASAALTQQQESNAMEYEKLYNEAKARNVELESELKVARSASTEVVALASAAGLASTVPHAERVATVTSLVALRGEVFKITGEKTPEGAVAALAAMKTQAEKTVALEAEREAEKITALTAELDGVLKGAVDEFKLEPAKKDELRSSLVKLAGGKVTRDVVDAAKVHVGMLTAKVASAATGGNATAIGGGALTDDEKRIAALCGVSLENTLKAKQAIEQRNVARGR